MINKSIVEVFGSKSQDGDKVKGLLLNALMRNSYEEGGSVDSWEGKVTPHRGEERSRVMDLILASGESGFGAEGVFGLKTPQGLRYYSGEGESRDYQTAINKASVDALMSAEKSPADSLISAGLELKEIFENLYAPEEEPKKKKKKKKGFFGF